MARVFWIRNVLFLFPVLILASSNRAIGQPANEPQTPPASLEAPLEAPLEIGDAMPSCCGWDWSQSKYRYQKFIWPIGNPPNVPTGPGYYSLFDVLHGEYRDAPPKSGYPRFFATPQGFADVDFTYVDNPNYNASFTERLHRIPIGDNWMFGTGGEWRNRYNVEENSRLKGVRNEYDLNRVRLFGDLWYQDRFRIFAEVLDARTSQQSLPPLLSDRNYVDFLNLFVDIKTLMIGDEAVYARLGRQQILLGSQRIISPSDWGFTLRTFDGVRLTRRSEKFDIDGFWLRPVVPIPGKIDSADDRQNFGGIYTTYRPTKEQFLETYWLYLSDHDTAAQAKVNVVGRLNNITPYDMQTLGFRYGYRGSEGLLFESENMAQMGTHSHHSIFAGNVTNGLGWYFKEQPMTPTIWAYFDYASGSSHLGGTHTFNQLYPLGHYYLGQIDYIGRANIMDWNFHMYLYPTKWITLNAQYHIFQLAQANDALYSPAGTVIRSDPSGKAGRNVGSEFDITANFHLSRTTDVMFAYCHFFDGTFLQATGPSANMNTIYLVLNFRW